MTGDSVSWRTAIEEAGARPLRAAGARTLAALETGGLGPVPADLAALLRESNGVRSAGGERLVWPVSEILAKNREFRDPDGFAPGTYAPFDGLLLFGETAGGDLFAFDLAADASSIVHWDHETDERVPFAATLREYLARRVEEGDDGDDGTDVEPGGTVVSVWAGTLGSREALEAYGAVGGSGEVSPDGLPLSCFQRDAGLTLADVLGATEQSVMAPTPGPVSSLLDGLPGSHDFSADVERAAAGAGLDRVDCVIVLYRHRHEPARSRTGPLTFLGSFEFD